jgi:hypothetical protein
MDIVALGTLTSLRIDRIDADHPQATAGIETGKYWGITPNYGADSFEVSLTLPHYDTPDHLDKLCRYTGTAWDCAMSSFDPVNQTITRDGVTAFSDWATGDNVGPTLIQDVKLSASSGSIWVLGLIGLGLFGSLGVLGLMRRR